MDDGLLSLARDGDVAAFAALARPGLERLRRIARIATGDGRAADRAVATALSKTRRDIRAIDSTAGLELALERALAGAVGRRPRPGARHRRRFATPMRPDAARLADALEPIAPADRAAIGRCLDPAPDSAALAAAARLGVDVPASNPGSAPAIVELDGTLTDWDLARVRAALAALDTAILAADDRGERSAGGYAAILAELSDRSRPAPAWLARYRRHGPPLRAILGSGLSAGLIVALVAAAIGLPGDGRSSTAAGSSAESSSRVGGTARPGGPADFPSQVDGFYVRSVDQAIGVGRSPGVAGAAIAVRGWLTPPALVGACVASLPLSRFGPVAAQDRSAGGPDASATPIPATVTDPFGDQAAFCERASVLEGAPSLEVGGSHLHVQFLPGTAVTGLRDSFATAAAPRPTIVLGHFGDPRAFPCDQGGHDCGLGFIVDRVLWAAGADLPVPVAISSPFIPRRLDSARAARIGLQALPAPTELVAVTGVGLNAVEFAEPAAIRAMSGRAYGWIVRIALVDGSRFVFDDPTVLPTMTWVLVDDVTGSVVRQPSG